MRNNKVTVIVILLTVVLAAVAMFTAIRLYQLRSEPVAPNAPTDSQAATIQTIACEPVTFSIASDETTASATPSASPKATATPSATTTPLSGGLGGTVSSPTATPTSTPRSTTTPLTTTPSASPTLPEAGVSFPTFIASGIGVLFIITALALSF